MKSTETPLLLCPAPDEAAMILEQNLSIIASQESGASANKVCMIYIHIHSFCRPVSDRMGTSDRRDVRGADSV
jgi:hypothetical protein